jgi:hypothetical protein
MDSWLSQDLAAELVRERVAEAAAAQRTAELVRRARVPTSRPRVEASAPTNGVRHLLAGALRGLAVRLDPALAAAWH